jgi:hypothetical protein
MQSRSWIQCLLGTVLVLGSMELQAAPIVYTLQTVGDGALGNFSFTEAEITIVFESNTSMVEATPSSAGYGTLFVNRKGVARVTITQFGKRVEATFESGEIYVFYDTGRGIAGFGSPGISPTYPVTLDCSNTVNGTPYTADCQIGNADNFRGDGTLSALFSGNPGFTPQLLALPQSLAESTLLTGHAHMCASTYTIGNSANTFDDLGNLGICGAAAPHGLKTNRGGFYVQDMVGGSNAGVGPFGWGGWDTSNVGYLQVSVLRERGDD